METKYRAWIYEYKELCKALSIDFVNNTFYVLPELELKGGQQIEIRGLDRLEKYILDDVYRLNNFPSRFYSSSICRINFP